VIYSVRSHSRAMLRRDAFADNRTNVSAEVPVSFLDACRALSDARQPYDVVFFGDGELRPDEPIDLSRYRTLVVAGCDDLTEAQAALLRDFDGRIVEMPDLPDPQVTVDSPADFAICIHRIAGGAAVHVVRYDYDEAADAVPPLPRLELSIRLPDAFARAEAVSAGDTFDVALSTDGSTYRLVLSDVPLYAVVVLTP
jgi:hypothetical protein